MDQKKRTEIASLGQFGLIDLLTKEFSAKHASTTKGVGDDAAVIAPARGEAVLCTTDSFFEGVDFDLTYFPLKHLGYKVVTAGISDTPSRRRSPYRSASPRNCPSKRCRTSTKGSPSPATNRASISWAATRGLR